MHSSCMSFTKAGAGGWQSFSCRTADDQTCTVALDSLVDKGSSLTQVVQALVLHFREGLCTWQNSQLIFQQNQGSLSGTSTPAQALVRSDPVVIIQDGCKHILAIV